MIDLNKYKVKSDGDQFIIYEEKTYPELNAKNQPHEKAGQKYDVPMKYFGTIEGLVSYIQKQEVMKADVKCLSDILDVLRDTNAEIKKFIRGWM